MTPTSENLSDLVSRAHSGIICLPEFQRDFVWTRDQTSDLLRSVVRGDYIGSLLLLRCDRRRSPFAPRAVAGAAPAKTTLTPDWLVMDGQQRLTALSYVFYPNSTLKLSKAKSPTRYFIQISVLLDSPDDDQIVLEKTEKEVTEANLLEPDVQFGLGLIPASALASSQAFSDWHYGWLEWATNGGVEDINHFVTTLHQPVRSALDPAIQFSVPVVELPQVEKDDLEGIARVCTIFEKINSTGSALTVYDLLTARLYPHEIDMRRLWEQSVEDLPRLAEWSGGSASDGFGLVLLRTLALIRGKQPTPKEIVKLSAENFAEDWSRAASALEDAIKVSSDTSEDGFGVMGATWAPGFSLLPVLAALRLYVRENKSPKDGQRLADIRRWYWCAVFLNRFSSALDSKARQDYQDLLARWQTGAGEPTVFLEAQNTIGSPNYTLSDTVNSGFAYKGAFSLLRLANARDWSRSESLSLQSLEDHHIFPKAYLKKKGFKGRADDRARDSVLNRTLISAQTNRDISAKDPATYVDDRTIVASNSAKVLAAHFIDKEALDWMRLASSDSVNGDVREAFTEFCNARDRLLVARVRELCGVELDPLLAQDADETERPSSRGKGRSNKYVSTGPSGRRTYYVTLEHLTESGLLTLPVDIRTTSKKHPRKGVLREDGSVVFSDGQEFTSMRAASLGVRQTSTPDWWTFWEAKTESGFQSFYDIREAFLSEHS